MFNKNSTAFFSLLLVLSTSLTAHGSYIGVDLDNETAERPSKPKKSIDLAPYTPTHSAYAEEANPTKISSLKREREEETLKIQTVKATDKSKNSNEHAERPTKRTKITDTSEPEVKEEIIKFLDWRDRPKDLQCVIDRSFDQLSARTGGHWNFNGDYSYPLVNVCKQKLVHHIIKNNSQKEFYFLDIGAGDFQWGDHLARVINQSADIPSEVVVHIVGMRGEYYNGESLSVDGKCHIHKLGAFKIEELETELQRKRLDLTGKVDAIVTSWCFRHLADPLGTFVQSYNLLKPHTGLFFGDGFFYELDQNQDSYGLYGMLNIPKLLLTMKVPFLIHPYQEAKCLNNFSFMRNSADPLKLPLKYDGYFPMHESWQVYSKTGTSFKCLEESPRCRENGHYNSRNSDKLYGDKSLFDYFSDNDLFLTTNKLFVPLLAE